MSVPVQAVVIGGSAGALDVLLAILPAVPERVTVPIVIVLHVTPEHPSRLAELFAGRLRSPVGEAEDKLYLSPGVWFAPSGYHLLIERDRAFALSIDRPVLHARPSIDVLFESAARAFGAGLVAVLLSGANRDGADGLRAVRDHGGVAAVQDVASAASGTMPAAGVEAGAEPWRIERIQEFLATLPTRAGPDA